MFISAAGGFFIAGKALAPIKVISNTIRSISESQLSERIKTENIARELRELAASFNQTFARLEKSFKRQKQFIADASHEFRTPLAIILSQSEITLRKERTCAEYKKALAAISEAAALMSEMSAKLLTLVRLGAEKIELKPEPTVLNAVIRQAVTVISSLAARKGVRIDIAAKGRFLIYADRAAILELFINIIENAIKYNILNGRIDIGIQSVPPYILTEVRDTGIGISAQDIDKVFDRFYRADSSRSKESEGSGLGLSICDEIVKLHGGKIEIASREGSGTTVFVYLKESGFG